MVIEPVRIVHFIGKKPWVARRPVDVLRRVGILSPARAAVALRYEWLLAVAKRKYGI